MHKLLTAVAASALALFATAAQADCPGHDNVTASIAPSQDAVSMSTHDGAPPQPVVQDGTASAEAAKPACADGDKDCAAGTK